jgi:UDP-N-acetylmuramate--alanine ligase
VTVFQPHRFSRTQLCWNEFRDCFRQTDVLFLLDIYPAGEAPIEGVDSTALAKQIDHSACFHIAREKVESEVLAFLKPGDICLTLGAGDISRLGEQMTETFAKG